MGNVRLEIRPPSSRSSLYYRIFLLTDIKQGAKAQMKRERNQKAGNTAKSQLKVNSQACDIQCTICKSTFLKTTKAPAYGPLLHSAPARDVILEV